MDKEIINLLKATAIKTIADCTFGKKVNYFKEEKEVPVLLPSGDEKYVSFWVRDCAMMAESKLIPNHLLKKYIEIISTYGQNGKDAIRLENDLSIPPYSIADHINYDGKPVYFPGTYSSGNNQGSGDFGFYPPFCDNYYYIIMVSIYVEQSGDSEILNDKCNDLTIAESLEYAFAGYNIDDKSDLCISDEEKYTVDWGFVDTIKKSGKLLMASLLRYNAARKLQMLFKDNADKYNFYKAKAEKIKKNILLEFYDNSTGWFYSATGIGKQYDVWATAYAVFSGITKEKKTLEALYNAYIDRTAVVDGYVRHILTNNDFSTNSAWESTRTEYNTYQNGAYWATPTGWYAYALYCYNQKIDILEDFIKHLNIYAKDGAPFEWIDKTTTKYSGLNYGTSGVLPYIGAIKIIEEFKQIY
ncbi:MAG: hypothetical protein IJP34_02165 [Clostridia bacterium]|nr:hypothetical protein [Clostridia bacterium]